MTVTNEQYLETKMAREIARKEAILKYMKKEMSFQNGVARTSNKDILKVLQSVRF